MRALHPPTARSDPLAPRARRIADSLPPIAGLLALAVGALNVASALTPDFGDRTRALRHLVPHEIPRVGHLIVLPGGVALMILALYLARRRRRAWSCTVALLILLGVANLLKGIDWEEALTSWALAGALFAARDAFYVLHDDHGWRPVARQVALIASAAVVTALVAIVAAGHWASPSLNVHRAVVEALKSLSLMGGPVHFREPFDWLPARLGWLGVGAFAACAWVVFRPLAAPGALPQAGARRLARDLVAAHGGDTLSFFKLRLDKHYFFSDDRRAFLAYQVHNGVLLVSGDPIGPPEALPALLDRVSAFAEERGLRVAVLGASEELAQVGTAAGLRSFYIGDEAIVDTSGFSLKGRPIRKVRQAVTRLDKAGYSSELALLRELPAATLEELEEISDRWREGEPERGFSMAMDSLRGDHLTESAVVIARDEERRIRGFLHFVPCRERRSMSLSFMRRDRDTPNGLTEYLVVRAIELLRERDVEAISLNFAAFARLMHSPGNTLERFLARLLPLANRYFQIESLYRFNAKFFPDWQPRYLLYAGALGLPRAGIAAIRAEGQVPKLLLPGPPRRRTG